MNTIQLKDVLPEWTPGAAISHRNLTLVPLQGAGHQARFQDYLLASEAIDAGVLTVTEVDDAGTVPELLAVNDADRPILLIDGEELQGAKQNRILNTSVLLPPKSKTRIPVSCVEEGRWSHVSPTFKAGNYSPSSLRQRKSRDVQRSLRAHGRAESDQGAVWDNVAAHIEARAAKSPTRAMADAMATLEDVAGRYHEALPYPSAACGVNALEIFAEPVNPRGPGLKNTQQALAISGLIREAAAIDAVRHRGNWSSYVVRLLRAVQKAVRMHGTAGRLRFLLHPSGLRQTDVEAIRQDGEGVVWLGKE